MKILIITILLISSIVAKSPEKQYWDEVKNSADIELLKSYKEQYPHGVFEKLADIKIKRLIKGSITADEDENFIPLWIKGKADYRFYGVGKANKHFKGKHYQENLARSRARRALQKLYDGKRLTNKQMDEYNTFIETKMYTDERERIYILLYIDNINIY